VSANTLAEKLIAATAAKQGYHPSPADHPLSGDRHIGPVVWL